MTSPAEPNRIIAIVLGASAWPEMPSLKPSSAFVRSAEHMRDYLRSEHWLGLSADAILDLFDRDLSSNDTDLEIRRFLGTLLEDEARPVTDVILYYTGHGDFTAGEQQFQLMLRSTREEQKDFTGYPMRQLAQTMSTLARDARKYVILDCCYAAAAFQDWQMQSGDAVNTAIKKAAEKQFAKKSGTALLCACNEDQWALYKDDDLTMFSGALMRTLKRGSAEFDRHMSIEEVHQLVANDIRERHDNQSVEPVLHVPKGRREALAEVRIFPNPAWPAGAQPELATARGFASVPQPDVAAKRETAAPDPEPRRAPVDPRPEQAAPRNEESSIDAPLAVERALRLREQDRRRAMMTAILGSVAFIVLAIVLGIAPMAPFDALWTICIVLMAAPLALHIRGLRQAVRYESLLKKDPATAVYLAGHHDVQAAMLKKRVRLFGQHFISGGGVQASMVVSSLGALLAFLLVIDALL